MTEKKLTPAERTNMQRNHDAVKRDIETSKRLHELYAQRIPLMVEGYEFTDSFKPSMKYQNDQRVININKKIDEIKWTSELEQLQFHISEKEEQLSKYNDMLSARG